MLEACQSPIVSADDESMGGMVVLRLDEPFAVFSDIHGNLPALVAVLADVNARGYAQALCLGDLVGYGPSPNEVVALVHAWGIPTVVGN